MLLERFQPAGAGDQRDAGLEAADIGREVGIVLRDVGRIGRDRIEALARRAAANQLPCNKETLASCSRASIAPGDFERVLGDRSTAVTCWRRPLGRDRECDGAAAGAQIHPVRRVLIYMSASARSTTSSVSGRGISTAGVTSSSSDQNSCCWRMYATGSPCARRLTNCWNDQPALQPAARAPAWRENSSVTARLRIRAAARRRAARRARTATAASWRYAVHRKWFARIWRRAWHDVGLGHVRRCF